MNIMLALFVVSSFLCIGTMLANLSSLGNIHFSNVVLKHSVREGLYSTYALPAHIMQITTLMQIFGLLFS